MNRLFLLALAWAFALPVFSKTLFFQNDTVPPVVVCPANDTIVITPGPCTVTFTYDVTATDDQPGVVLIQTAGLVSGADFPLGNTVNTFMATDTAGNAAMCSFVVWVEPIFYSISCYEEIEVRLDSLTCTASIVPEMLLEPGPTYCTDVFSLIVGSSIPPHLNAFDGTDVGTVFPVFIIDTASIQQPTCLTNVKIIDALQAIQCTDLALPCIIPSDDHNPEYLAEVLGLPDVFPEIQDYCDTTSTLSFNDQYIPGGCDGGTYEILLRTWKATDAQGQTATCSQRIDIRSISLTDVLIPEDTTYHFSCTSIWNDWYLPTKPFIVFQGKKIQIEANSCTINWTRSDAVQTICPGMRRVTRTFTLHDACTDGVRIDSQFILLPDVRGPLVHCDSVRLVQTLAPNCVFSMDWLPVVVSEACSYTDGISVWWLNGPDTVRLQATIINGGPLLSDTIGILEDYYPFPAGETQVVFEAVDACGNLGSCRQTVVVWDNEPPALVCNGSGTTVYLDNQGRHTLHPADWVTSATDLCGTVALKIRRESDACQAQQVWDDATEVCCSDIGDSVVFEVRAYDVPIPVGGVDDTFGTGQFSSCIIAVFVVDTASLKCSAPPDTVLTCLESAMDDYGSFTRSCPAINAWETTDFSAFDSLCGNGTVVRMYTVEAANGTSQTCMQSITVTGKPNDLAIHFPDDMYITDCLAMGTPIELGKPIVHYTGCNRLEITYTESINSSACYGLIRNWRIRNRCFSRNGDETLKTVHNPAPHPYGYHPSNMIGPIVSAPGTPAPWTASTTKVWYFDTIQTNYSDFWDSTRNGYFYKQIITFEDTDNEPELVDCVVAPYSVPDSTENDPEFWNDSLLLGPAQYLDIDRPEAPYIYSARGRDNCRQLEVHAFVYLDLNDDGVRESVVSTKQVNLPRGSMRVFNTGANGSLGFINSAGTLMAFDKRPVPDLEKYRFVVRTEMIDSSNYLWEAKLYWEGAAGQLAPVQLPHGNHQIRFNFINPCDHAETCVQTFRIQDGAPPALQCRDSIFIPLDTNGQAQITSANVLLSPPMDNLSSMASIVTSLNKGVTASFPQLLNGQFVHLLEYNCWSPTFQKGQLWAKDSIGNAGFCTFFLKVQDTESYCNFGAVTLGGRIYTYGNRTMPLDEVYFDPQMPLIDVLDTADASGRYQHAFDVSGVRFDIQPRRNHDPVNGVSTFDLVLINKHILDLETLDSPYKIIAADANGSRSVTTGDIAVLRRLILGVLDTLPGQLSWRFIDSSYVFPNPSNPFANLIPFKVTVYNPPGDQLWHNFVGIKIGDVNDNADVDSLLQPVDDRQPLHFNLEDQYVEKGEIFNLYLAPQTDVTAYQFTLDFPGFDCLGITPDAGLTPEHAAIFSEKNKLTFSNDLGGKTGFNLRLRALESGFLSEKIKLSDAITPAEAWTANGERLLLQLVFLKNEPAASLSAQPNIFTDQTVLVYSLPSDTKAELLVYNAAGQILMQQTVPGTAGEHQFVLQATMVNHVVGALVVQLKTTTETMSVKLVRQ